MEKYRPYNGRKHSTHRRRSGSSSDGQSGSSRSAIKLYVCIGLFIAAVLLKFVFPAAFETVGDKLNTVVNYRAALATLGEGISGEKKFTSALGEAFTYAFTGEASSVPAGTGETDGTEDDSDTSGQTEDTVTVFGEDDDAAVTDNAADSDGEDAEATDSPGKTFADAVIAAFMQDQSQYSDYAVPAGVSYGMPKITLDYTTPLAGVVSSPFGYREHPTEGEVRFHYGVDIAAESGAPIAAFADGKVIAEGETETLGKYVVLLHGHVESQYAHCSQVYVADGQAVKMGQTIAAVGMTGNATNPHLHFELKVNGVYVNPDYYMQWC